ncbi:MAG: His/Gly/Thr/Pro-type tRNA ligase C-terminal domain-containing protein, partial [Candidatus Promineifilaceae bacterium]
NKGYDLRRDRDRQVLEHGTRVKLDDREPLTPGYKVNVLEIRGVPVRVEVGPRDVAKGSAALARRDIPGREGKQFVTQEGVTARVIELLDEIHRAMYDRAQRFLDDNTRHPEDYDSFKETIENGFARVWWDGSADDELRIKEETRATIRCLPLDTPEGRGQCFYTGRKTDQVAVFGRGY